MVELTITRNLPTAEAEARREANKAFIPARNAASEAAASGEGFVSRTPWMRSRPKTLVVACSDGRLQKSVDEFLNGSLNVFDYDRMYVPGGPGALVADSVNPERSKAVWQEFAFLLQAHEIANVVLLFHGAAQYGPPESVCAYYRRLFPQANQIEVARQQERDAAGIRHALHSYYASLNVSAFRAEVEENDAVRFVTL